jgi:general secretion pathway protein F
LTAFRYEAADAAGRIESGVLDADSAKLARGTLRQRGMTPLMVEALGSIAPGGDRTQTANASAGPRRPPVRLRRALSANARVLMIRQLASLVVADLPLAQALAAVQEQAETAAQRELFAAIRADVMSGQSLARAFARHPRDIPELDRALIAAGEQSGNLGTVLTRLADHIERRAALAQKVTLAFAYPAIVTVVALIVITALLTYVVPQIVGVFAQTKQKLPMLTIGMIALSNFLRNYGWVLMIAIVAAMLAWRGAMRTAGFRRRWHRRVLKLPLAGPLAQRADLARFADTLAILVGAGVPILRALQAARDTMSNLVMRDAVDAAVVRVREGASLSKALAAKNKDESGKSLFPPVLLNLIASGEATGKLPEMLERAATGQSNELERRTLLLTSMLEPALVLVMGVIVLLIVLAILMPIIELNQLIR